VTRRAIYLVDGEHHPPVLRAAIEELRVGGTRPLAVVVAGGGEKLTDPSRAPDLGAPTVVPEWAEDALAGLLRRHRPDVVVDLSGEPVVTPTRRNALAAISLAAGVPYEAPGWRVDPPDLGTVRSRSSVAVISTGKRTGKTAISGALARHALANGRDPTVVAMGRGGPPEPVVLEPGIDLSTLRLLEASHRGRHAASDFYEDAITSGARTVGCLRVGDGPSGQVGHTNVPAGVEAALRGTGDLLILEGSGAALPPVMPHAVALVVPATAEPRDLAAGLPLRMLLADIVLLTFAGGDPARSGALDSVVAEVRRVLAGLPESARPHGGGHPAIATTDFRPRPLEDISGLRVALITTAEAEVNRGIARALEEDHGARVVASSSSLADRPRLLEELRGVPDVDAVLVELKAAAVDTVMEWAQERGLPSVVLDHEVIATEAGSTDMSGHFDRLIALADERRGPDEVD
jgi:cyclic 2,3-diphosphoglycerate synthetase